jgi:hypothetical protein
MHEVGYRSVIEIRLTNVYDDLNRGSCAQFGVRVV